jgi:hypothetical protein
LTFTPGEILTAANLNVVSDQTVMVFDDAAARTTAIPSPVEGMVTYLKDTDLLEQFDGTNFVPAAPAQTGVLQVVSTTKTDAFSVSVAAGADVAVTGLTASITPSSTSSKIFVNLSIGLGGEQGGFASGVVLLRDSTKIALGDSAGSRVRESGGSGAPDSFIAGNQNVLFLDTPNTDSSITYSCNVSHTETITRTIFVNRGRTDTDSNRSKRTVSTLTLMEVAG